MRACGMACYMNAVAVDLQRIRIPVNINQRVTHFCDDVIQGHSRAEIIVDGQMGEAFRHNITGGKAMIAFIQ